MRQDQLQVQLLEILEGSILHQGGVADSNLLELSEQDMFKLWNLLGEELGIDLSLATPEQRHIIFSACEHGKRINPKEFANLLWLIYYAEPTRH